jgi:hypothetical protein
VVTTSFPAGVAGLHRGVRLHDLVEVVDAIDRDYDIIGGDGVEEALQHTRGQIRRVAAVGGQPYPAREVFDGVEVAHRPLVGQHPGEAHDTVDPGGVQRVRERGRPDQLERGLDPLGKDRLDLPGDGAIADEHMVHPNGGQRRGLSRVAGRGQRRHALLLGQDRGGYPDRGGAAADEDGSAGLGVEADSQRPVGRLKHLGDSSEGGPGQAAAERDDLGGRDAGVLGVAAVEHAAHAAHHRDDLLCHRELLTRALGDDTGRFDAQHTGKHDALGQTEPGVQLGAVEPERLNLDQDPPRGRGGHRELSRMHNASGGPDALSTMARMVSVIYAVLSVVSPDVCRGSGCRGACADGRGWTAAIRSGPSWARSSSSNTASALASSRSPAVVSSMTEERRSVGCAGDGTARRP